MADDNSLYTLRGGKWGYDRLLLLSRDRWPDTAALFKRAGLTTGMRCMDLGCGGGEVTMEMARWVSPSGSAVGIDMDSVKLDLGTKTARDRGMTNVVFRQMYVDDWNEQTPTILATRDFSFSISSNLGRSYVECGLHSALEVY